MRKNGEADRGPKYYEYKYRRMQSAARLEQLFYIYGHQDQLPGLNEEQRKQGKFSPKRITRRNSAILLSKDASNELFPVADKDSLPGELVQSASSIPIQSDGI